MSFIEKSIRPDFVLPPKSSLEALHNPAQLIPEQVGIGYRLCLRDEPWEPNVEVHEYWSGGEWVRTGSLTSPVYGGCVNTYRVPSTVPFPETADEYAGLKAALAAGDVIQFETSDNTWSDEPSPTWNHPRRRYRIKPAVLPDIPGVQWHREDWRQSRLAGGYRPLALGEKHQVRDEASVNGQFRQCGELWAERQVPEGSWPEASITTVQSRTKRPLEFSYGGHRWTHYPTMVPTTPGNIVVLTSDCEIVANPAANDPIWKKVVAIRLWVKRLFDVNDITPGTVFRHMEWEGGHVPYDGVMLDGVCMPGGPPSFYTWEQLEKEWFVNQSFAKTGTWDGCSWRNCFNMV